MLNNHWYEIWFNTGYHDLLYQHRNEAEAKNFIDRLINFLQPPDGITVLDAACGKGRHAQLLAQKGFDVTGIDLSYKNIREAKKYENEMLTFYRHDMRNMFRTNYFDLIINIYTSFGYFESKLEDLHTMHAFALGLKKGGKLVLDFLNVPFVLKHLMEDESKVINGIEFKIRKDCNNGHILKKIEVNDSGNRSVYYEKVSALQLSDFENYFNLNQLKLTRVFGDYELTPFDLNSSERMIMIAEK